MPDIPLLQPVVLRGVVEKFTAPESLTMLSTIPNTPNPYPVAQWDVLKGSRSIAQPNVPNAEAHVVPRLTRSQESSTFLYLREKKTFEPTTLYWLREPGTLAGRNAEKAVLRELQDLNTRFDNFVEYAIWRMFTGVLTIDSPYVQASIDYKLPASHKPTVSNSWATATPAQIVADIRAWKRLVQRDSRVAANRAYVTEKSMAYIFDSFATTGSAVANFQGAALLSDRMKDQYYSQGTLPGFMGLDWQLQEAVFDATNSGYTENPKDATQNGMQMFLDDDAIILGNFTENRPFELLVGPTADIDAPQYFTGKFSKSWIDPDPSARQFMLEWNVLPVMTRPEQIVYVGDVAPGN